MSTYFLIRLDDACETMDFKKWNRIENLFDKFSIKPLIAVIPNNKDEMQKISLFDPGFWDWLRDIERKGWKICMHGNSHVYLTDSGGRNPVQKRSEFAEIPFENQCEALREGILKFRSEGFHPQIFVAPSHTFDSNTLLALKIETGIKIISDTIAFYPYAEDDFIFIPQQFSRVRNIKLPGLYTFCYHPSTMSESDMQILENFLQHFSRYFLSFQDVELEKLSPKSNFDKIYSFLHFQYRKIRNF